MTPGVTTLEMMRAAGANRPPSEVWPEVRERDIGLPMRDGATNRARVYSSATPAESKPLLIFAFGGAYITGSLESEEAYCRSWAKNFGGVAVNISYRSASLFFFS